MPAFTGAEADAAACPSHGRCFSLLPPSPKAFPLDGSAVLNDTPVACQTRGPTDPQGDRCPHIPAALAATYPLRCFAPQWARFDNRHSTSAPDPTLAPRQRQRRRGYFAPQRELLLSAVTKVAKSTGRNYVSALPQRATVGSDLLRILADITFHHRCQSKGLRVRSPARRLTRPLASATAGVFAPTAIPQAFPLDGSRC